MLGKKSVFITPVLHTEEIKTCGPELELFVRRVQVLNGVIVEPTGTKG